MKKINLLTILLLFISTNAWCQIALSGPTGFTSNVSTVATTTCNFSHDGGASPTLALVFIGLDGNETISGTPTYGGSNMTLVTESTCGNPGDQHVWLYEIHSPATGSQTVDVDFSADDHHTCVVFTFSGTDTTDATIQTDIGENSCDACATITTTLFIDDTTNWAAVMASWHGGDTDPFTETNFTERGDGDTGGDESIADDGFHFGEWQGGTSGLRTFTSDGAVTDECAFIAVEISDDAPPTGPLRGAVMVVGQLNQEEKEDKIPYSQSEYNQVKLVPFRRFSIQLST